MATLGRQRDIGCPCQKTSPAEGAASPESMRSSVDFPEPEGPRSAVTVPASSERSRGAITWIIRPSGWRKLFSTCRATIIGSASAGCTAIVSDPSAGSVSTGSRVSSRCPVRLRSCGSDTVSTVVSAALSASASADSSSSIKWFQASSGKSSRKVSRSAGFMASTMAFMSGRDRECRST